MTKDEALAQLRDELRGLLLDSWAEARRNGDFVRDGQYMTALMRKGNSLFDRTVAAAAGTILPKPPEPARLEAKVPANGTTQQPPATNGSVRPGQPVRK